MTLQHKTIQRYRHFFPQDTLKQISLRTGIQITRVFRLFNGKPMKVGELEAFDRIMNEKLAENPNFARVQSVVDEASSLLTNDELGKIADYLERRVTNKKYARTYIRPLFEDAGIA